MESPFAALLRRHRMAAGLTQEELSTASGVSVQAISTLERGTRRYPQLGTVAALANALHLDPGQRAALVAAASRPGKTGGTRLGGDMAGASGVCCVAAAVAVCQWGLHRART